MRVSRRNPLTGRVNTLSIDATPEQLAAWRRGTLIQDALPHLAAWEREFLINGTLPGDLPEDDVRNGGDA